MYTYEDMILLHNGPVTEDYIQFVHYVLKLQKAFFNDDLVKILKGETE